MLVPLFRALKRYPPPPVNKSATVFINTTSTRTIYHSPRQTPHSARPLISTLSTLQCQCHASPTRVQRPPTGDPNTSLRSTSGDAPQRGRDKRKGRKGISGSLSPVTASPREGRPFYARSRPPIHRPNPPSVLSLVCKQSAHMGVLVYKIAFYSDLGRDVPINRCAISLVPLGFFSVSYVKCLFVNYGCCYSLVNEDICFRKTTG